MQLNLPPQIDYGIRFVCRLSSNGSSSCLIYKQNAYRREFLSQLKRHGSGRKHRRSRANNKYEMGATIQSAICHSQWQQIVGNAFSQKLRNFHAINESAEAKKKSVEQ